MPRDRSDGLSVSLPAPEGHWYERDVASFVGARLYMDVGTVTYVGKVSFSAPGGVTDDVLMRSSHVDLRVDDWAVASS